MGKFYGAIGFAESTKTRPGVFEERITEYPYYGDVIRNTRRWEKGENLNDNLNVNNSISVVADPFAYKNFQLMRYVNWMGVSWKITNVEVLRPRLLLTIGGVYNGPKPETGSASAT
jgi:hypothetical protein